MDLIKQETEKRKERNIRYLFILTVSVVDQLIFIFSCDAQCYFYS